MSIFSRGFDSRPSGFLSPPETVGDMFLSSVPSSPPKPEKEIKLDPEQQNAVYARENRVIVVAGAGSGKALKNGTGVLTPSGYVPIEFLKSGDVVYDQFGKETKITGVFPQGKKEVFKVTFSDGNSIECCSEHIWRYQDSQTRDKRPNVFYDATLAEIIKIPLRKKSGKGYKNNVYIPTCSPVQFAEQPIPIHPYAFGALLGNGHLRTFGSSSVFSCAFPDIISEVSNHLKSLGILLKKISDYDYVIVGKVKYANPFNNILENLNLLNSKSYTKHIPKVYLFNSVENRLELLKGLMDTDGSYSQNTYEYSTSSEQLAEDVSFLAESLGCTVSRGIKFDPKYEHNGKTRFGRTCYRLYIKTYPELGALHKSFLKSGQFKQGQTKARRYIKSIEKTNFEEEMTCISVESSSGCFLTEHCIVTHNTRVLTERIKYLIEQGASPHNIVAITFTNLAADEMRERLSNVKGIGDAFIGTIHSFANKIMQFSGEEYLLYTDEVDTELVSILIGRYCDNLTLKRYVGYKRLRDKYEVGEVSEYAFHSYLNGSEKAELALCFRDPHNIAPNDKFKESVYNLFQEYRVISFDELLRRSALYFKSVGAEIEHVLVDEFQDVGNLEYRFIMGLNAENFFFVGDDFQSLYEFKGSNVEIFKALAEGDSRFTSYYLTNNYRNSEEILEVADKVISQLSDRIPKDLRPISTQKGTVEVDLKNNVRNKLADIKSRGDYKDWFILTRSNKELYGLSGLCKEMGIPYVTFKREGLSLNQLRKNMQSNTVKVLTVHASKGLESDNVILYGNFPIVCPSYRMKAEERRVMYVGITRARNELYIFN